MSKHGILAIALSLIFTACQNTGQQGESHQETTSTINLNQGEKWQVNPEMKPHIERGQQLLADYVAGDGGNYQELAENLKVQNKALIKSCTMKGESHDELHKWLHPHLELTNALAEAESAEEAEGIVSELQQSFKTYKKFFQ
jgi:hypothetical protein